MASNDSQSKPLHELTPKLLVYAYCEGIFPMADSRLDGQILWFAPDPRAIIPLDGLHVSKSLARTIRSGKFEVTRDRDFRGVIRQCAALREGQGKTGTWISTAIEAAYTELHDMGLAHSVECWHGGQLVGGLYGVALGGAFFGESMFHTMTDASKVALAHLVGYLNAQGYELLDTQYTTAHLIRMGAVEIPRSEYESRLQRALRREARWEASGLADGEAPVIA